MLRVLCLVSGFTLASLEFGCTVVTSCPTTQPPNNTSNGGSTGNAGSSGAGSAGLGMAGTPLAEWTNATSDLAGKESECGNLGVVAAKPDEDLLIAGVAHSGLWSSTDGGDSWQAMGSASDPEQIINRPTAIIFDPAHTSTFWESGIYSGSGVFRTDDDGASFTAFSGVTHTDFVDIDLGDPARLTLLAGGHEQSKTVNLSTDGGAKWMPVGASLPDKTDCTIPLVVDASTFLVSCGGYGGGPKGLYRSTDAGASWAVVHQPAGSGHPLHASDGSYYWGSGEGGLLRSQDAGETWTQAGSKDQIGAYGPVELPDGRIAAIASNVQGVAVSADQGATWQLVTSQLPFNDVVGVTYSAQQKAFYVWHLTCDGTVPADAIMRADFDYEAM